MKTVSSLVAIAVAGCSLISTAADFKWVVGTETGNLDSDSVWNQNAVPGENDALYIESAGTVTAGLQNDLKVTKLQFKNPDLTFALGDKTLTLTGSSVLWGSGTFNLTSGSLVGLGNWSVGATDPLEMNVTGSGTYMEIYGQSLGASGSGHSFTISDGACVKGTLHLAALGGCNNSTLVVDNASLCMTNFQWNGRLYVCSAGANNRVVFKNGAKVDVPSDYMSLGVSNKAKCNEMLVTGEGTECKVNQAYIGASGPSNTLYVTDGALFQVSAKSMDCYVGNSATAIDTHVVVSNATFKTFNEKFWTGITSRYHSLFEVMGENAKFETSQFALESGARFLAKDGAHVKMGQLWTIGNNNGGDCHLILSNAVMDAVTYFKVGSADNCANVTNCSLDVCGGTYMKFPDYTKIYIGTVATDADNLIDVYGKGSVMTNTSLSFLVGGVSKRGVLRVRDGGKVYASGFSIGDVSEGAVGSAIEVLDGGLIRAHNNATYSFQHDTRLLVRNGTLEAMRGNGTLTFNGTNTIQIAGTNTHIRARYVNLNGNSTIEFKPPEDAAVVDSSYIEASTALNTDGTAKIKVVDMRACGKNGGGVYTILSSSSMDLSSVEIALDESSAGCTLIRETGAIKVKIPNMTAFRVIVR